MCVQSFFTGVKVEDPLRRLTNMSTMKFLIAVEALTDFTMSELFFQGEVINTDQWRGWEPEDVSDEHWEWKKDLQGSTALLSHYRARFFASIIVVGLKGQLHVIVRPSSLQ